MTFSPCPPTFVSSAKADANDGLTVLRMVRSRQPVHTDHMIRFLTSVADCMASAKRGTKIPMDMLTQHLGKTAPGDEAVVRAMLMIMATGSFTESAVRSLARQLHETRRDRRRPVAPKKEARARESSQLF